MKVSVKNNVADILVNTVILAHNKMKKKENVEFLRCHKCGTGLNQVRGFVGAIYAGYVPSDDVAIISRCHNCQENYTYHTEDTIGNTFTKLILSSTKNVATFHCITCRTQLLQYTSQGAVLLPLFTKLDIPSPFFCFNQICKGKYLLRDIVEPETL